MLIWKSTKEFGIAKYITPSKKYVMVVARFHPQGNWNYYKDFAENVFPPVRTMQTFVLRNMNDKFWKKLCCLIDCSRYFYSVL
jgi:hypothetical protein